MNLPQVNRLCAAAVAIVLALGPATSAMAAPALRTNHRSLPAGATEQRYEAGKQAYDGGDYADAGKSFSEALDLIPEAPRNRGLRTSVVLDAIAAYREAYAVSGDVRELEHALDTYYRYFSVYRDTYNSPNIPRPVVTARFALKEAIRDAKAGGGPARTPDGEPSDTEGDARPSTTGDRRSTPAPAVSATVNGRALSDNPGTPLIGAGAAIIALGVGSTAMIAVGAVEGKRAREDSKVPGYTQEQRDRIDERGRSMNALLIAGAVVAPVLVGVGAALVAVGVKRNKKSRIQAVAPAVGPGFAGLAVRGRF